MTPALIPLPSCERWAATPWSPRRPQLEALPLVVDALELGRSALVHMVMGSGKSILLAAVCASFPHAKIVVSAPTKDLVNQLSATLRQVDGLEVGRFFGDAKKPHARVVVACNPSLGKLAEELASEGETVDILVVDEAHNSQCRTVLGAVDVLAPKAILGLTATPFRSDQRETLSLFGQLLYSYGPGEALADGVVVPFSIVPWKGEEGVDLDEACVTMIGRWLAMDRGPGIVDAETIADAEAFAARLCEEGVRAAAVHSQLAKELRAERLSAIRTGELDVLVHVSVLKEGVDIPELRFLCLRRDVGARVHFVQHVGRVMRAAPGKNRAWILDPQGLFRRHALTYDAALGGEWEEPADVGAPALREEGESLSEGKAKVARRGDGPAFEVRSILVALSAVNAASMTRLSGWAEAEDDKARERQERWSERCYSKIKKALPTVAQIEGAPASALAALRRQLLRWDALSLQERTDLFDLTFALIRREWPSEVNRLLEETVDVTTAYAPSQRWCADCGRYEEAVVYQRPKGASSPYRLVCRKCGGIHLDLVKGSPLLDKHPHVDLYGDDLVAQEVAA